MKRSIAAALVLLAALSLFGCSSEPKTFTEDGLSITLPSDFKPVDAEGFSFCYGRDDCAVFALKEGFDQLEGAEELTLREYADMVLESNGLSKPLTQAGDHYYFEFVNSADGENFSYLACCYRAADAFWLVQFSCPESKYGDMRADMLSWADTVTFD